MATEDPLVAALLRERESLVQSGLTDRVPDVDEQLKAHGYKPSEDAGKPADPASRSTPPKDRRARSAETT